MPKKTYFVYLFRHIYIVMFKSSNILIILALLSASCKSPGPGNTGKKEAVIATVTVDTLFNKLFIRKCCGFTGGDGTYSVLLPDGRSVWIFGDTFLGTVNQDNTRERISPMYIRNSFVIQDGDSLRTLHQVRDSKNASMVIPPVPEGGAMVPEHKAWFWPGDGLIENGQLKVFMSLFTQPDTGMWGFQWESSWLASYSLPDIREINLEEIDYSRVMQVHYGHAVLEERDYTYVYGAGEGHPHAARYPAGKVEEKWEFFNGQSWVDDPAQSKPMGMMHASEQFSVFKIKEKYVYLTQMDSFSTEICSFVSESPVGPWENKSLLYTTPIPNEDKNLITYNALAHPQFMDEKQILVSYNMNSFGLEDHFSNADIYRPRFIRVPLKMIDPDF